MDLFLVSTAGEAISPRQELYKLEMSREEGIISYFMKISGIQYQLQELGEEMSYREIATIMLNALLEDWGNLTSKKQHHSRIYGLY